MTEAKVPENGNDWKSIDIFLFSNGQQFSPPRKYHLVTQQLNWWNTTLNFLAKAQYGSLHSMIDLYTIEGKKVETPLQLNHNTAYVAVVPPDFFIDAGYDKYLIKATRSWEKGQVRRSSSTAVVQPTEPQALGNKSNSDIEVCGSPNDKEITDESVDLKTILSSNQASVIVKPESTTEKNENNNSTCLNSEKQSDKANKPSPQRPGIVKKNNPLPSSPRTRQTYPKRKDSVKINTDTINDRPKNLVGRISLSDNNKAVPRSKTYKPLNKKRDSLPEAVLSKVEEVVKEIKSSSSVKVISQHFSTGTENVVQDNEIISIPFFYKNPYSECQSIGVNARIPLANNNFKEEAPLEHNFNSNQFVGNQYDEIENEVDGKTTTSFTSKNNVNDLLAPVTEKTLFKPPFASTVSKPDDNEAVINKQGTVNLKLNIEIWNDPNKSKTFPNTAYQKMSLIDIQPEKGSQVNIGDKTIQHQNQLHKIIAKEMGNYCEGNHKVITVKCSCLNNGCEGNTNDTVPVDGGNSNFFIFLPILKLNEECKSCEENPKKTNASNSSVYKLVKQMSCLSLNKFDVEKIVSHAENTSRNNSVEVKAEANKRKSVAIKEDETLVSQVERTKEPAKDLVEELAKVKVIPQKSDRRDYILLKKESTGTLHQAANKFTQTAWCDVLVEVRVQDDGHYSFHMPPLEMLKYYKQ